MEKAGSWTKSLLMAAILAGFSYFFVKDMGLDPLIKTVWKGSGVGLLALYAAFHAEKRDGWMITAVMGFGALGDVLIERSIVAGAGAFILGHIVAIMLYLKHKRASLSPSQKWLAIILVPAVLFIAWNFTHDGPTSFYALFLAMMAGSAWISQFPRYRTGIGAMLFLASDLLIFARDGQLASPATLSQLIWPLYFAGQVLILLGVVTMLNAKAAGQDQSPAPLHL